MRARVVAALATLLGASALGVVGCGAGSVVEAPSSLMPSQATRIAKCRVSASETSPLVTEWSASEKARIETLMKEGAVAVVSYGCEIKIVDACKLGGSYSFRRTTLATDTLEIANTEELFARLPLGAAGLEAELRRAGRLAVRTTVAGQYRLAATPEVPSVGACAEVTHVVSAMSVGAFKLLAGGASEVRAGIAVAATSAGVGAGHHETVLREAGSRDACAKSVARKPDDDARADLECASPIQIFLAPVARNELGDARQVALPDSDARPEGSALVELLPDEPTERWTLRTKHGRLVCRLPCTRWIGPQSKLYLQLEDPDPADTKRVLIPDDFGVTDGAALAATPKYGKGSFPEAGEVIAGVGLGLGLIFGAVTLGSCGGRFTFSGAGLGAGDDFVCPGGTYLTAIFGGIGLIALPYAIWARAPHIDTAPVGMARTARAPTLTIRVGPGFVFGSF